MSNLRDAPNFDMYEAAREAMQVIKPPEGLTPNELHEFWIYLEVHAYYERITNLARMCGLATDYSNSHSRKLLVAEVELMQDHQTLIGQAIPDDMDAAIEKLTDCDQDGHE